MTLKKKLCELSSVSDNLRTWLHTKTTCPAPSSLILHALSFWYIGHMCVSPDEQDEVVLKRWWLATNHALCTSLYDCSYLTVQMVAVWNDRSISLSSKIWLMHSLVTSIFLHACESWTLTAELQRNEVLPQDNMHLIQRPRYQRGSQCQDPAGNRTTRRPPDIHKETQTAVVWSCLPFVGSGQNYLARYSERGKKTRQTEEEVGRQH